MARTTKADVILEEARGRISTALLKYQTAERNVLDAQSKARIAEAELTAYQTSYDALKLSLAPKPRGKSTPAPSAAPRSSRKKDKEKTTDGQQSIPNIADAKASASSASSEKPELCGICGNERDFNDHVLTSRPGFHEFEGRKASAA
jgi:hypothetical protein